MTTSDKPDLLEELFTELRRDIDQQLELHKRNNQNGTQNVMPLRASSAIRTHPNEARRPKQGALAAGIIMAVPKQVVLTAGIVMAVIAALYRLWPDPASEESQTTDDNTASTDDGDTDEGGEPGPHEVKEPEPPTESPNPNNATVQPPNAKMPPTSSEEGRPRPVHRKEHRPKGQDTAGHPPDPSSEEPSSEGDNVSSEATPPVPNYKHEDVWSEAWFEGLEALAKEKDPERGRILEAIEAIVRALESSKRCLHNERVAFWILLRLLETDGRCDEKTKAAIMHRLAGLKGCETVGANEKNFEP